MRQIPLEAFLTPAPFVSHQQSLAKCCGQSLSKVRQRVPQTVTLKHCLPQLHGLDLKLLSDTICEMHMRMPSKLIVLRTLWWHGCSM